MRQLPALHQNQKGSAQLQTQKSKILPKNHQSNQARYKVFLVNPIYLNVSKCLKIIVRKESTLTNQLVEKMETMKRYDLDTHKRQTKYCFRSQSNTTVTTHSSEK